MNTMELSNQNKNLCFNVETNARNVHRFGVISHRNEFSTCWQFSVIILGNLNIEQRLTGFIATQFVCFFNSIALRQFYLQVVFIVCVCMHLFCRVLCMLYIPLKNDLSQSCYATGSYHNRSAFRLRQSQKLLMPMEMNLQTNEKKKKKYQVIFLIARKCVF